MEDIVYLRKVDAGTPNECWVVCAKGDPGAVAFVPQSVMEESIETARADGWEDGHQAAQENP